MRVDFREEPGGIVVFALAGESDSINLPTISEGIDKFIQTGRTRLVFNIRGLKFFNSSSLGYLIQTHKRLRECGGELVLSEPSQSFETIFATLGIGQIF